MNKDISAALRAAASNIDIPEGNLDGVLYRANRRTSNRRRLGTVFTSIVILGALVATVTVFDRGDQGTQLKTGSAFAQLGDDNMNWVVQNPSKLGQLVDRSEFVEASGALYALSTAPGERSIEGPRVVWRSNDGLDWEPREPLGGLYLSDLAARDNRIYAVGTAPASLRTTRNHEVASPIVAWSDDEAQSWEQGQLPVDLSNIADRSISIQVRELQVATSPQNLVATALIRAVPDVATVLPAGMDISSGWAMSEAGIDILKPGPVKCPPGTKFDAGALGSPPSIDSGGPVESSPCLDGEKLVTSQAAFGVATTYTWEQLGIEGDFLQAVLGEPFVFRAGEDGVFKKANRLFPSKTYGVSLASSSSGGFIIGATTPSGVEVYTSSDGITWAKMPSAPGIVYLSNVSIIGDRFALFGQSLEGDSNRLFLGGSEGWQQISLREIAGVANNAKSYVNQVAMGPSGAVALVGYHDDQTYRSMLLTSRDGQTWSVNPIADIVRDSEFSGVERVYASGRGVTALVGNPGETPGEPNKYLSLVGTYR